MTNHTKEKLRQIKQSFRLFMNGSASRSMRDKGLEYKINWGVPLPQLRELAKSYGKDYDLAAALWQEPIRECKIMATLIMPAGQMTEALADEWIGSVAMPETAELCAFNLFQHLDFALPMSMRWLRSANMISRVCAYHTVNRLLQRGEMLGEADADALLKAACDDLSAVSMVLKHAAANCLTRLCSVDAGCGQKAKKMLENVDIGFFV